MTPSHQVPYAVVYRKKEANGTKRPTWPAILQPGPSLEYQFILITITLRGTYCRGKIPDHLIGSRNPKFLINFICGRKLITANMDSLSMRLCKIAPQMSSYVDWTHRWRWSFVGHLTMLLVSQTISNELRANGKLWIERIWKEAFIILTRYYCRIFLKKVRKTTTDRLG